MNESELYKELGVLTKDRDRWKESIFGTNSKKKLWSLIDRVG